MAYLESLDTCALLAIFSIIAKNTEDIYDLSVSTLVKMANDFVGIDVKAEASRFKAVRALIDKIPIEARGEVTEKIASYLLNVLRHYPPYKKVTRKEAFGSSFFSDKQRRFFFWALGEGIIDVPYKRTQSFAQGWQKIGEGENIIIANETPYGPFLVDPERQSRLQGLIGWQTLDKQVESREQRITEIAAAVVKRVLRKIARGG